VLFNFIISNVHILTRKQTNAITCLFNHSSQNWIHYRQSAPQHTAKARDIQFLQSVSFVTFVNCFKLDHTNSCIFRWKFLHRSSTAPIPRQPAMHKIELGCHTFTTGCLSSTSVMVSQTTLNSTASSILLAKSHKLFTGPDVLPVIQLKSVKALTPMKIFLQKY